MIYFFVGENSFEVERAIAALIVDFDGAIEKKDPEGMTIGELNDLLAAQTLFSERRLVVIKQLSENKAVWDQLHEQLERVSDDVTLVLVESKPDKRTKTYKELHSHAMVREFHVWTQKDQSAAVRWVQEEAVAKSVELTLAHARQLVQRAGLDQWRLSHALDKLAFVEDISNEAINELVEAEPDENVFSLLETALREDTHGILKSIAGLRQTTDAYQTMGLLDSQILQLAPLALSDKSSQEVATDIGAHPFVLSKLTPYAKRLNKAEIKRIVADTAEADILMKSTGHDPWLIVEQLLLKIAQR